MKKVIITSGGTIVKIDDVRYLTNFSGGTTGAKIAEAFLKAGFHVDFVYGKGSKRPFTERKFFPLPKRHVKEPEEKDEMNRDLKRINLSEHQIFTFDDYLSKVKELVSQHQHTAIILAAAVSDYGADKTVGKISSDKDELVIRLTRNPKVISMIKTWDPNILQIGFKLLVDTDEKELVNVAREHGIKNHSDLTVANIMTKGELANRDIYIVDEKFHQQIELSDLGDILVDYVENMRNR